MPRLFAHAVALFSTIALSGCAAPSGPAPRTPARAVPAIVAAVSALPEGGAAPAIRGERGDVPLVTLDGAEAKLADYGAKVTVIAIWGMGCVPCIRELPYVDALFEATSGDREVAVLTLVVDDVRDPAKTKAVREITARLGLRVPVLFDRDIRVYRRLNGEDGPQGKRHEGIVVPQLVIIDSAFTVRRHFGFKGKQSVAEFVAEQRALIELARRGQLPPEEHRASPAAPPTSAGLGRDDDAPASGLVALDQGMDSGGR